MTLKRMEILSSNSSGRCATSASTPLTRARTAMAFSHGSMCRSLAPSWMASCTMQLTSTMISRSWAAIFGLEILHGVTHTGVRPRESRSAHCELQGGDYIRPHPGPNPSPPERQERES